MRAIKYALIVFLICFVIHSCRERYGLPIEKGLVNSLVVEGNILLGDTTVIRLSRVTAVAETNLTPESGAFIMVEGDDNSSISLHETEPGVYKVAPIALNQSVSYRLRISSSGKEYESEWTSLINTSDIDSVYWERSNGVEIFVKSSGTNDDSKYYKWDYDEVFEFFSKYKSILEFTSVTDAAGEKVYQCIDKTVRGETANVCVDWYDPDGPLKGSSAARYNDTMYHCWKYDFGRGIRVGSTAAQSDNVIISSVRKLPDNGWELASLYSILVKQTGLSKECYEFYQILRGNSEGMGSIFDAQPSQMTTNFRCISDPSEIVIGFINATSVKSRRIFISVKQLRDWHYFDLTTCSKDTVWVGDSSKLVGRGPASEQARLGRLIGQVPAGILSYDTTPPYIIRTYTSFGAQCVDCRTRGLHKKPEFWPQ